MEENGVLYNHITMGNGASFEFVNGTASSDKDVSTVESQLTGGSGQYLVFRIRVGCETAQNLALIAYDGQTAGYVQDTHRLWSAGGVVTLNEWVTYVVDLTLWSDTWYKENNLSATTASFALNAGGEAAGRYIDVQYFAVCDNWDEIETVVGSGTVQYTKWTDSGSNKTLNCDGSEITQ